MVNTGNNSTIILSMRKSGRTTRLADEAIQALFHLGECYIWDHHLDGKSMQANNYLFEMVMRRLDIEHHHIMDRIQFVKKREFIKISFKSNEIN